MNTAVVRSYWERSIQRYDVWRWSVLVCCRFSFPAVVRVSSVLPDRAFSLTFESLGLQLGRTGNSKFPKEGNGLVRAINGRPLKIPNRRRNKFFLRVVNDRGEADGRNDRRWISIGQRAKNKSGLKTLPKVAISCLVRRRSLGSVGTFTPIAFSIDRLLWCVRIVLFDYSSGNDNYTAPRLPFYHDSRVFRALVRADPIPLARTIRRIVYSPFERTWFSQLEEISRGNGNLMKRP